jgi:hypothetical protein
MENENKIENKTPTLINIADLLNHSTGKTFREENLEKQHNISIGSLVEIQVEKSDKYFGVRLYIVAHTRDCDGTPLYRLGLKNASIKNPFLGENFYAYDTFGGFDESSLKIIFENKF